MYTITFAAHLLLGALTIAVNPAPAAVADRFEPLPLSAQRLSGWLAGRMRVNLEGKLLHVDRRRILDPFRVRGESEGWSGEHIGKFLDAAAQAWLHTGDRRLHTLMTSMFRELVSYQDADGYLGTYAPDKRFTGWDLWTHKYNLLGLLAYFRATADPVALGAARKIGDLLLRTFGDAPGQKYLRRAGGHEGMVATSVLEPMVMLYRLTGDARYLEFSRHVADVMDRPDSAKLLSSLTSHGRVNRTANAKAYEMLSNLVGLTDLYRITGDQRFLTPVLRAWDDIVRHHLFVTGTTSRGEYFGAPHELHATAADRVGEGCATVTWLQLNWHLLRLLGENRFADEIERTTYNALLGAQHPRTGAICYFTPLIGKKPYGTGITCCASSEPRGISLIPALTWGNFDGGIAIWQYEAGRGSFTLPASNGGRPMRVALDVRTRYPIEGSITIRMTPARPAKFALHLRVPPWTQQFTATVAGTTWSGKAGELLRIERQWKRGDQVRIENPPVVTTIEGGASYPDTVAIRRGPRLLSLDRASNPGVWFPHLAGLPNIAPLPLTARAAAPEAYVLSGEAIARGDSGPHVVPQALTLVPFADTGDGRICLRKPGALAALLQAQRPVPVTAFGDESLSGFSHTFGSFTDGDPGTFARADGGRRETGVRHCTVELAAPVAVTRVAFAHAGENGADGWFDTTAGKPRFEYRAPGGDAWQVLANLDGYPDTRRWPAPDAGAAPTAARNRTFEARLPRAVPIAALRITGQARSGGTVTCAELEAFE